MDYKIAIAGSPQAILGFKALGLETFPLSSVDSGREILKKISAGNYAILLISEDWAVALEEELNELKQQPLPAVTVLPSQLGSQGLGYQELRKIVEKAVGSDILFKN
ncbi:MAG: V-type ATP synthase subunit F [Patescibacteria group bacterium]|nr:V-type ATP synthase subunit F [Patescibacteria group bacterium]